MDGAEAQFHEGGVETLTAEEFAPKGNDVGVGGVALTSRLVEPEVMPLGTGPVVELLDGFGLRGGR